MENVDLIEHIRVVYDQIKTAKTLVDDGKEVKCSQQLQGAKTRCIHLLTELQAEDAVISKNQSEGEGEEDVMVNKDQSEGYVSS